MKKASYKTINSSNRDIKDRLLHKHIDCTSNKYIKWAKNYLKRSYRRKLKQEIKNISE